MKSAISCVAILATSLSLAGVTQGANETHNPELSSCPVETTDGRLLSVVGIHGTGLHPRLELRELEKDPIMWNLFIQAFARFQAMDQNDKRSYFQISAIHGAPYVTYDGVESQGGGSDQIGYCPHASNLFGTWHRPYLILFEQMLHNHAVDIANQYPVNGTREKYLDAAMRLRLPYWDWALDPDPHEGVMPSSLRRPTALITAPNGTQHEIPNPLLQYDFHPLNPSDFAALNAFNYKFSEWKTTIRNPVNGFASNATSRNDEVNSRLTAQQVNNRDMLYKLLTIYQPFNEWSSKSGGGKIGNIETLHDGIHSSFGLGHMSIVDTAAFDPVFWFHHCNVDRIIAMYQHRYPDTFVEPANQPGPTYTTATDSVQDINSNLYPFHMNTNGDFWTSQGVRNWETFGYTYPELQNKPSNETLTLAINNLYRPVTPGLQNATSTKHRRADNATSDATDWMAEVNMPSDIQMTYSVRAFLGPPPEDPEHWATDPNYVGQVASLASPKMDSDVIVTANIMLTERLKKLFDAGALPSLERADVEGFLHENFFWRIQKIDNTVIPRNSPPEGLNATVLSVPIHLPSSDMEVPTWTGGYDYKPSIEGHPPPPQPNGTEPEVVVLTSTIVQVVTVTPERIRKY